LISNVHLLVSRKETAELVLLINRTLRDVQVNNYRGKKSTNRKDKI
jgi:hypothetical protein